MPEEDRLPTNELFQAYDSVLPTYGIDPEDDQHLSRLVFRIGGERGDGTLLEKFRAVLSRMGIEIVFDNSGPVPIPQEPAFPQEDEGHSFPSRPLEFRPARARSDTELSDHTHESLPASQPRSHSYSSSSGVTTEIADTARLISSQAPPRSSYPDHFIQPSALAGSLPRPTTGRDIPPDAPLEYPPTTGDEDAQAAASVQDSEDAASQSADNASDSEDQLEERATQREEHRLASLGAGLFRDWNELAMEVEAREPPAPLVCTSVPPETVESLLVQWKEFMEWKTDTAEEASRKEAYYRRCDRLATRAREIYILATTLTLWHDHALYRAERTAVARRHILRFRHFDSWKDLAVSEERAVRVFAQSLYFPRWADRHETLCQQAALASKLDRDNLLSKTFTTWQLGAFENSVQSRSCQRLRESTFAHWLQITSSAGKADVRVRSNCKEKTLETFAQRWRTRASDLKREDADSLSRFRETTLSNAFRLWLSSSRPERAHDDLYTANVLSSNFRAWHLETQVDAFERQQNHRLVSETFASWMTFQKAASFQSQRESTLKETAFELFLRGSEDLEAQGSRGHILQAARCVSHASITSLFQTWFRISADVTATGDTAYNSTSEAAKIAYLNNWFGAALHNAELNRWARRGYSYLAVHENFDLWKTWAKREKERKLRATYTKAKHDTNVRLVLGCWRMWQNNCDSALILQGAAEGGSQSHDRGLLHTAMDRWISSAKHDTNSDRRCQLLIMEGLFEGWAIAAAEHANGESETTGLWVERLVESCWSRWDIAHQWTGGQAYNAENAAQRRDREMTTKHFLRWLDIAVPGRFEASDDGSRGLPSFGRSDIAPGGGRGRLQYTPARVQPWSRSNLLDYNARVSSRHEDNQDDELDSIVGGMNTPTKWTGLARPLAGLSSTTPSVPLPTPYERELRMRYAANPGTIGGVRGGADTHDSGLSSEHVSGGSGGI